MKRKPKKWMVNDYVRVRGWESEFPSMAKLLRHLKTKHSGSESSRRSYRYYINKFCQELKMNPDQLVALDKTELEERIEKFLTSKLTGKTANDVAYILKAFFNSNRIKDLEIPTSYQPTRGGRKTQEYIPTTAEAWRMVECAGSLKAEKSPLL